MSHGLLSATLAAGRDRREPCEGGGGAVIRLRRAGPGGLDVSLRL